MKLSVVVANDNAPDNAFVIWRGFERSIEKAAACGYDGVELALGLAGDVNARSVERALYENGIKGSCISTGLMFAREGLYMTHPDPEMRRRTVEAFYELVRIAPLFGGMINVGRSRGFVAPGGTRREAMDLLRGCMDKIAPYAAENGVQILLEPIKKSECNFIGSLYDGSEAIRELGHPNVRLMADVFHMCSEDGDVLASIGDNIANIAYVHVAGEDRTPPGRRGIDYAPVVRALRRGGYDGWLSVEITPGGEDADARARESAGYMRGVMGE